MSIETLCLREAGYLSVRSPKYWQIIVKMYLETLRGALPAKVFRASYFFCRHIDDVLDGDRSIPQDPKSYVERILEAMDASSGGPEIVELYRFAIKHLATMTGQGEDPSGYFKKVIRDAMLFDYERARTRQILSRKELAHYYSNTFAPVMDLALMISGSSMRSNDLPESVSVQGRLYSIRDLRKDLRQGIVNIPSEIMESAGIEPSTEFGHQDAIENPIISAWMLEEVEWGHDQLRAWKDCLKDRGAKKVCTPLILQMEIFCKFFKLFAVSRFSSEKQ